MKRYEECSLEVSWSPSHLQIPYLRAASLSRLQSRTFAISQSTGRPWWPPPIMNCPLSAMFSLREKASRKDRQGLKKRRNEANEREREREREKGERGRKKDSNKEKKEKNETKEKNDISQKEARKNILGFRHVRFNRSKVSSCILSMQTGELING